MKRNKWLLMDPTYARDCADLPGCYVIYKGPQVLYVGQSESVYRRIRNYRFANHTGSGDVFDGYTMTPWGPFHWRDGKITGKACYPKRYGEHLMLEARLIRRLQPQFNRRGL
jgi:hypothetical protein